MRETLIAVITLVVAPLIGGLLFGIDRKITARMQRRVGPPIRQPFYDVLKLIGKDKIVTNKAQLIWAYGYLFFAMAALVMLVLGQDLLMLVFVLAFAGISFILGGFSTKSPYSHIGSNREIMQMVAYEPVLILFAVGVYLVNGSFIIKDIFTNTPLLVNLWPIFIAVLVILTIKMRKSPFDISTSHHGHQEIVKGITTEYSGPYLALIELTHWYELILVLGLISLFWATPLWIGILIALGSFILELFVDNICARMYYAWMIKFTWTVGLVLCVANIIWLLLVKQGVI
jgi:ech hydrogenase subunit B